jgi:hypothetical protein
VTWITDTADTSGTFPDLASGGVGWLYVRISVTAGTQPSDTAGVLADFGLAGVPA